MTEKAARKEEKEESVTPGAGPMVRVGVIGAGLATRHLHWPPLTRLAEQFTVTYVADVDEKAAQGVADMAGGCRWTRDYREVLASSDVDAVLVSLPIHLNAQVLKESALAGKHVICEKPIAANLEQARDVVASLRGVSVVVLIAENFHYRADIRRVRRWIDEGRIGKLFMVDMICLFWNDTSAGFASTPWRMDSQYRGGAVADGGVHHSALLREVGGEVEQIEAFAKLVHPEMSGIDTLALNIRFRNGALGRLLFTDAAVEARTPYVNATILGTEGTITMQDRVSTLHRRGEKKVREEYEPDEAYYEQWVNFYEAIQGREAVKATPEEAMRDLEIIMRALDSAEHRSVVLLS